MYRTNTIISDSATLENECASQQSCRIFRNKLCEKFLTVCGSLYCIKLPGSGTQLVLASGTY